MPKLAKKTKKNDTATMPSLYSSPPCAESPRAMAMTIQQVEQAAAETIMTFCVRQSLSVLHEKKGNSPSSAHTAR